MICGGSERVEPRADRSTILVDEMYPREEGVVKMQPAEALAKRIIEGAEASFSQGGARHESVRGDGLLIAIWTRVSCCSRNAFQ